MAQLLNFLLIYKWIDFLEISFLSVTIYYFSLWLKRDVQKNLAPGFFTLCSIIILSYALDMNNISNFLIIFMPSILMLFILVHQNILQKNFISIKNIAVPKIKNNNWIDLFMRHCLNLMNQNKQITCAIEGRDNLEGFLINEININTPVNKEIIDLIVNSSIFKENKIVHINYQGDLLGVNAVWNTNNHTFWISEEVRNIEIWKQDSLLFSSKTDVLVFKLCPKKRNFDIIAQGKIMENLAIAPAVQLIGDFIKKNIKDLHLRKDINEIINKESSPKQPYI